MLNKLRSIVEKAEGNDRLSRLYDIFMISVILLSILPLCVVELTEPLILIDRITAYIFIVDYILRFITVDCNHSKRSISSFLLYPFRPMAVIDLLSILPSLTSLNHAFRVLKMFRLFRTLRVFKFFRYSENLQMISHIIVRKRQALATVGLLASAYIFISALIVFQVEPQTFGNLFHAVYWATISLTTVGYGDIYPVSDIGRIVSMISSFLGIAVVALPSGIIISGYQEVLEHKKKDKTDCS